MDASAPDPFDPDTLRLPSGSFGPIRPRRRPPRHRPGEPFLRGPIPFDWWAAACRLPGHALHVASAIRFRSGRAGPGANRLGLADLRREMGVGRDTARRALRSLAGEGLIRAEWSDGAKPLVSIVEAPEGDRAGSGRRPLFGPIPWAWWLAACRLPGRSLHVASALWCLVGWSGGRDAEFDLGLSEWSDLGLSRFSAGRGLAALEGAGLVSVLRSVGRTARVALLDATEGVPRPTPVESEGRAGETLTGDPGSPRETPSLAPPSNRERCRGRHR